MECWTYCSAGEIGRSLHSLSNMNNNVIIGYFWFKKFNDISSSEVYACFGIWWWIDLGWSWPVFDLSWPQPGSLPLPCRAALGGASCAFQALDIWVPPPSAGKMNNKNIAVSTLTQNKYSKNLYSNFRKKDETANWLALTLKVFSEFVVYIYIYSFFSWKVHFLHSNVW